MLQELLQNILAFLTSERCVNIVEVATLIFLTLSKFWNKIANISLEKQLNKAKEELAEAHKVIDKAAEVIEVYANKVNEVEKIAKAQCEAMKIAFDNSNLTASAKLLVADILKGEEPKPQEEVIEEAPEPQKEEVQENEIQRVY